MAGRRHGDHEGFARIEYAIPPGCDDRGDARLAYVVAALHGHMAMMADRFAYFTLLGPKRSQKSKLGKPYRIVAKAREPVVS